MDEATEEVQMVFLLPEGLIRGAIRTGYHLQGLIKKDTLDIDFKFSQTSEDRRTIMKKNIFFTLLMLIVLGSCGNDYAGWPPDIKYNIGVDGGSTTFYLTTGIIYFSFTGTNGDSFSIWEDLPEDEIPIVTYEVRAHNLRYIAEVIGSWFEIHHHYSPMVVTVQPNLSGKERWLTIRQGGGGVANIIITQSAD